MHTLAIAIIMHIMCYSHIEKIMHITSIKTQLITTIIQFVKHHKIKKYKGAATWNTHYNQFINNDLSDSVNNDLAIKKHKTCVDRMTTSLSFLKQFVASVNVIWNVLSNHQNSFSTTCSIKPYVKILHESVTVTWGAPSISSMIKQFGRGSAPSTAFIWVALSIFSRNTSALRSSLTHAQTQHK